VPFRGPNVTAVLTALAVDTPAPILDKNPQVPEPLAKLVMWLLEKDPQSRPQSAEPAERKRILIIVAAVL
jgi:hypothetical protein